MDRQTDSRGRGESQWLVAGGRWRVNAAVIHSAECLWMIMTVLSSARTWPASLRHSAHWPTVMGRSQLRFRFKSRFQHIWRLDLNDKHSIQKTAIYFEIGLKNWDSIWKKVKSRQISCLLSDEKRNAQIVETLLPRMQFNVKTAPY